MTDKILLEEILPLDTLSLEGKVLLVRHKGENLESLVAKNLIEEYQSYQRKKPAFTECYYIVSFIAEPNNQARLFGVFKKIGMKEKEHLPKLSDRIKGYCTPLNIESDIFLELERVDSYKKYENRLIIDWKVPRGWYSTYGKIISKEVVKILPYNFVSEFPGLKKIRLTAYELKKMISNPESHSRWFESLTRLQAVYLILDKKTGNQYVGTTYGKNGLWQRWESYAKGDFTGGNKELKDLKKMDNEFYHNFQYSILEVLSKNASQKECIEAEGLWKEKLGSRTFGLNKN